MHFRGVTRAALFAVLGTLIASATPLEFNGVGTSTLQTKELNGGAIFTLLDVPLSTGTGIFPAFLQIHQNRVEEGYNSEGAHLYDEVNGHTTNVLWNQLGTFTDGGIDYYLLQVDWNESNGGDGPEIALLDMRIYSGPPNLSLTEAQLDASPLTTLQWSLIPRLAATDGGYDSMHFVDANNGQGRADLTILIPQAGISPGPGETHFILYAKFGYTDGFGATDSSFEEFSYFAGTSEEENPPEVPEPATYAMLGGGLMALGLFRRFRK